MQGTKLYFTNRMGNRIPAVSYVNSNYAPGQPLVIALHGNGQKGSLDSAGEPSPATLDALYNNNNFANLLATGDSHQFNVFTPQFIQDYNYTVTSKGDLVKTWAPEWSGGWYIHDAVLYAIETFKADKTRIYLTGLSGGGGGCWSYITTRREFADLIAACVPVCGTELSGTPDWDIAKTVPVWGFHGEKDTTINQGATIRQCTACGGKYTIFPAAGHSIWGTVYNMQDMYAWMLGKSKNISLPEPDPEPTPDPAVKFMQSVQVDLVKKRTDILFKDSVGNLSSVAVLSDAKVEQVDPQNDPEV